MLGYRVAVTREEIDAFIAAPFAKSRTTLFDHVARLLLAIFFVTFAVEIVASTYDYWTDAGIFGHFGLWIWIHYCVLSISEPIFAAVFVLMPFALKVAAFRYATTPESPARVSDIVGVRFLQSAALIVSVGSLLGLLSIFFIEQENGSNLLSRLVSGLSPLSSSAIGVFVFVLCRRISPPPTDA